MIILINESKETETFFFFYQVEEEILISMSSLASKTPLLIQVGIYIFVDYSILLISCRKKNQFALITKLTLDHFTKLSIPF